MADNFTEDRFCDTASLLAIEEPREVFPKPPVTACNHGIAVPPDGDESALKLQFNTMKRLPAQVPG
jgi:hypothetical protein